MADWESLLRGLRGGDYARYLSVVFAPVRHREMLVTIWSFLLELRDIPQKVSEPALGHIRLQWWLEVLEEIARKGTARHHPVIRALQELYTQHPEIWPDLLQATAAHATLMEPQPFATMEDWQNFVQGAEGGVRSAIAKVWVPDVALPEDFWGKLAAVEWGVRQMRQAHRLLPKAQVVLPVVLMKKHGAVLDYFGREDFRVAFSEVVLDLCREMDAGYLSCKKMYHVLPRKQRVALWPLILPAYIARRELQAVKRNGGDVLSSLPRAVTGRVIPRMWLAGFLAKI